MLYDDVMKENNQRKENSEFKPALLFLKKLTSCHILPMKVRSDKYIQLRKAKEVLLKISSFP